jgi:hypothetical protein
VGGLAGLALGYGLGWGVGGSQDGQRDGARYGLGGMAIGLLAAALLSRSYKDDLPPSEAIVTRRDGRWALGLPKLEAGFGPLPRETRLTLRLAGGEF